MTFMEEFEHLKIQLEDIKSATHNFASEKLIGRGGFGLVYRGQLQLSEVAFKRLDRKFGQGDPEFWKEIMMLSRYKHQNLVSLLRFCNEGDEKILVYEYASRGSLDRYLTTPDLTCTQRLKICIGAARGLVYLHDPRGTHQRLLHCDIKSSNILLDDDWNAKVSDFGLSKVGPANQQHTYLFTNVAGTIGYCDPLYLEMGYLTKESDVYSFGVVLFEVLCGKLCCEYSNGKITTIFLAMWKRSYEEENVDDIVSHYLKEQMDENSLATFSAIAYRCLHRTHKERPTMVEILEELETALKYQESYEEGKQSIDLQKTVKRITALQKIGRDEDNLIPNVPNDLTRGIHRDLRLEVLKKVPVIEQMDEKIINMMCDRLRPVVYTEESYVVREGERVNKILFVTGGILLAVTTKVGRTNFSYNSEYLRAGDFYGEELLMWMLDAQTSPNLPISTRTVQAVIQVEAFVLTAHDLELVASYLRFDSKQLRNTFKFYSRQWRMRAARSIQIAWRQSRRKKRKDSHAARLIQVAWGEYRKKKQEDSHREDGKALIEELWFRPRLGSTFFAVMFVVKALRVLRRNGTRKTRMTKKSWPLMLETSRAKFHLGVESVKADAATGKVDPSRIKE